MQYKMAQNNVLEGKTSMYKEHEGSEILINLQKISVVLLRWKHWAGNRERFFNVALHLVYKASDPSSFHFLLLPIASSSIISLCFSTLEKLEAVTVHMYMKEIRSIKKPWICRVWSMEEWWRTFVDGRGQHTELYYMNMGHIELVCVRKNVQKIVFWL